MQNVFGANYDAKSFFLYLSVGVAYILLLRLSQKRVSRATKYCILAIAILTLSIFAAIRLVAPGGIGGNDAYGYLVDFRNAKKNLAEYFNLTYLSTLAGREPVYFLYATVCRFFTDNYHLYFFMSYTVIAFGFTYFLRNYCRDRVSILLGLLILYPYIHSFNAMRSWMAISLCLIGLVMLLRQNMKGYYIIVLIAGFVHYSALLFLLIPIAVAALKRIDKNPIKLLLLILGANAILIFSKNIIMHSLSGTKYEQYLTLSVYDSSWSMMIFVYLSIFLYIPFLGTICSDLRSRVTFDLLLIECCLSYAIVKMGGYRFADFFIVPQIIAFHDILRAGRQLIRIRVNYILLSALIYIMAAFMLFRFLKSIIQLSGIMPYIVDM